MKITIDEFTEPSKPKNRYPYIAKYGTGLDIIVLVTGPGRCKNTQTGKMISSNDNYAPFEYECNSWTTSFLTPFKGKITIDCE